MNDLQKKIDKAIQRLKSFEPEDGYYLAYSGGKDSDCIRILAELANVKHENVHNLTTVDAPETVQYIKSLPDVRIERPRISMWRLIEKKGIPPTRLTRYCCSEFKERYGQGKIVVTGVRWAESVSRSESADVVQIIGKPKTNQRLAEEIGAEYSITNQSGLIMNTDNDENRRMVEMCYRTSKTMINPIIDWTDNDVWKFLNYYGCKSNPLYECGFKRIGCIGCPMASKHRYEEFRLYPKYRENYVRAFNRMIKARIANGKTVNSAWRDGEAVMRWWLGEDSTQITLEEVIADVLE